MSSKAENVDKKDIPLEEIVAEHKLVDSQRSSMINETDPFSSLNDSDSDSEATAISSPKDDSDSSVDHHLPHAPKATTISSTEDDSNDSNSDDEHHWSHDLVLCASPEAVSLPLSLEGRVMGLEQKLHELQEQTKSLQGGLGKLGMQLGKLGQILQTGVVTE
ncbi:hypothetical protein GALMADRAFT_145034 [Galerina marginata CBS 339.88]|uniref:Uncharacterized protein n=1 Tax=Galerina marginata (strain CBS 339.88) TaxID=685588 RepID=A0A067STC1_GALM3|nr:hypothetical protein GALMADRAFT_145034 [Galerina marginata CBS 339.88]